MDMLENQLNNDPDLKQLHCSVSWLQSKQYYVLFAEFPYTHFMLTDKAELNTRLSNATSHEEVFEELKKVIIQKVERMVNNSAPMENRDYRVRLVDHNKYALATNGYARIRFLNYDVLLLHQNHYVYVNRSITENMASVTQNAIENTKKDFEIAIEPVNQIRGRKKWIFDLAAIDPIGFGDGVLITSKSNNVAFVLLYSELLAYLANVMKCEKLWLAPLDTSAILVVPYEKKQKIAEFCSNTRRELAKLGYVNEVNYIFDANNEQMFTEEK